MRGRAFAEGPVHLNERETRLMNAGSSMKPRKAQVKDKGFGAECWDLGLRSQMCHFKALYEASATPFPLTVALSAKT